MQAIIAEGLTSAELLATVEVTEDTLIEARFSKARFHRGEVYFEVAGHWLETHPIVRLVSTGKVSKLTAPGQINAHKIKWLKASHDLEYGYRESEMKESLVLKEAADVSFEYELDSESRLEANPDGSISMLCGDEDLLIVLGKPFAVDAEETLFELQYELTEGLITLIGDLSGAVYPIVIDPSVVVQDPADAYATRYPNVRHLARAPDGRLWCSYVRNNGSNDAVFAAYSDDDGDSWDEEAVSTGEGDHVASALAIDSNGYVHCVYQGIGYGDYIANYQIIYRKRTDSWQAEEAITNIEADQQAVAIAIDSSDYVHVAWCGKGWNTYTAQNNVKYRKRTDTWQAQESVTDVDGAQKTPSIAVDSDDYVHLVWNGRAWGEETANYNIQYRKRTGTWQTQEDLTDIANAQEAACVALDSNEIPHVAWYGSGYGTNSTKSQIVYSNRIGGTWAAGAHLTDRTDHQGDPSISIDASDRRYVVWQGKTWGVNVTLRQICLVRYESSAWQAIEPLTDRAFDQRYPSAIWAYHSISGSFQPNIPTDGCAFVFSGKDAGGSWVEYMYTDDLAFPEEPEEAGLEDKSANMAAKMIAGKLI